LEYTKILKFFFTPHQGDKINWATKGITNATMVSEAKMLFKIIAAKMGSR
jgi:hypothetical protein